MLAAAVFVAGLAFAAALVFLGRGQASPATPQAIKPLHPVKHRRTAEKRAKTPAAPKRTKRKHPPAIVDGMPATLAAALAKHDVVVVSLYSPNSKVDVLAEREARAGATIAGAGFVALDVTMERNTRPLTSLLAAAQPLDRELDSPAVLVFQRPKSLYVRLNGFNDAQTIAQAAANAAPVVSPVAVETASTWADGANAACTRMATQFQTFAIQLLQNLHNPTNAVAALNGMLDIVQRTVAEIRSLKAPAAYRASVARMLAAWDRSVALLRQAVAGVQRGQRSAVNGLVAKAKAAADEGDHIASSLGATRCGGSA